MTSITNGLAVAEPADLVSNARPGRGVVGPAGSAS